MTQLQLSDIKRSEWQNDNNIIQAETGWKLDLSLGAFSALAISIKIAPLKLRDNIQRPNSLSTKIMVSNRTLTGRFRPAKRHYNLNFCEWEITTSLIQLINTISNSMLFYGVFTMKEIPLKFLYVLETRKTKHFVFISSTLMVFSFYNSFQTTISHISQSFVYLCR